jgi:hypothetical protein
VPIRDTPTFELSRQPSYVGECVAAAAQATALTNIEKDICLRALQRIEELIWPEPVGADRKHTPAHAEAAARYRFRDFVRRSGLSISVV